MIFLLSRAAEAQTIRESDQIYVRIYEVSSILLPSEIVISYGEGETEKDRSGSL